MLHVCRQPVGKDARVFADAPSVTEFENVWKGIREGKLDDKQRRQRKHTTIEWCFFEALRDEELAFLASAVCISLAVDERNGRLLIKYFASNKALEVQVGCLGLVRDPGGSAHEVAQAIHLVIQRLCTRRVAHRGMNALRCQRVEHAEHVRDIVQRVEMYTADGAANEQLAAKILHPASVRNCEGVGKLPALKLVLRDKAHASRRLTERSFRVDADLNNIWETLINGGNSIARLLENSRVFKGIFSEQVSKQSRCGSAATVEAGITELGFSKDRFDSKQKPLSRCVLNLDALIATALLIFRTRESGSKEGQGVRAFMDLIDERTALLLGMMADASDECLLLTRFFDREAFHVEEMSGQVEAFRRRLRTLFAGKACLTTGHTAVMMSYLRTAKMVHKTGARMPVSFGGREPSDRLVNECLGKMVAWCRVVEEVASTEFPDYELLGAFQVFRLLPHSAADRPGPSLNNGLQSKLLSQLAMTWGVDANGLCSQFFEHRRLAQDFVDKQPTLSVPEAWRLALKQTQSTARRRKLFPADALLPVLARYVVAPGSTSGVEQTFSKFKRVLGEQWNGSEQAEERRLVLELAAGSCGGPAPNKDVVGSARVIWASCLGTPRLSGAGRKPGLGMRVMERQKLAASRATSRKSATAWLQHRRKQVGEAMQGNGDSAETDDAVAAAADAAWSERHQKELERQRNVRSERAQAAVTEGSAGPACLGESVAGQLQEYTSSEALRQAAWQAKHASLKKAEAAPNSPQLMGLRTFLHPDAKAVLHRSNEQWCLAKHNLGLIIVDDCALADICVVLSPSEAGDRLSMVAAMRGGYLVTPMQFIAPAGVCVKLHSALTWPRHIYISQQCSNKHRVILELAMQVFNSVPRAARRWTWYREAEGADGIKQVFLDRAAKRRANGHVAEMVTILVPEEMEMAAYRRMPNRQLLTNFLVSIRKMDASFTHMGYCGR